MSASLAAGASMAAGSNLTGRLSIGPLPDAVELDTLFNRGVRALINVSGIDLTEIHGGDVLGRFTLGQWTMRDVFTVEPPMDLRAEVLDADVTRYISTTTVEERAALREAVHCAARHLKADTAVFVCCHRGRGRSPLAAAAALGRASDIGPVAALREIAARHAMAHFSSVSLAAARWLHTTDDG